VRSEKMSTFIVGALLGLATLTTTGCAGKMIANYGYTPAKVWYHTVKDNDHAVVVCDLQKDGAEANCKSTGI
jgi:hypothetical protein